MLDIYLLPSCPYCQSVIACLDELKCQYRIHDITDEYELKDLILIGGKEQVPYLYDGFNKIGLYESGTIINYLRTRKCK